MGKDKSDLYDLIGRLQLRRPPKQHPYARQVGIKEPTPQTPGEYFSRKFPSLADTYGPPVLEHVQITAELRSYTVAYALNEDFFAGVVAGDPALGHHVVFYVPEQQWYFFDCRFGYYVPTTEEKLLTVLSQHLIRCAEAMPVLDVDVGMIFLPLRAEQNLKEIIRRARSINAADRTFFEASNGHKRRCGERILDPATEPSHKLFIREAIIPEPERILTTNDCFDSYTAYCEIQKLEPAGRKPFTGLMTEGIHEQFGLGFRKDLVGADGKCHRGWKGLTCRVPDLADVDADAPVVDLVDVSKN